MRTASSRSLNLLPLVLALAATIMSGPAFAQDACALRCSNQEAAMCTGQEFICPFNFQTCMGQCEGHSSPAPGPHYDPCYIKQNALRPCTPGDLQKAQGPVGVDSSLVGTWEVNVPNQLGVSRWVWEIRPDGTYKFHAEGPGAVPGHSGTFAAAKGHYSLNSTTLAWNDTGTYQVVSKTTLVATGRLGTGTWQKVQSTVAGDGRAGH